MANSINRATLLGHLGRDPEIRSLRDGSKVANLSLATSDQWTDKASGERKERTAWHSVVIFGPLADIAERYLRKGSRAFVSGSIETRKWQTQDGQARYTTEIVLRPFRGELVLLDKREDGGGDGQRSPIGAARSVPGGEELDDSIPF